MNLQQIRDFVRLHLDIEIEDLPDAVLDVFIAEGVNRIATAEKRWPFFKQRWDLETADDQDAYDLTTLSPTFKEISGIKGPRWTLTWIGEDDAAVYWPENVTSSSEPTHFSIENDTLYLHPTPNDSYALIVRGYRKPTAMAAAGDEPDLPEEFHNTVALWALAKAYSHQDDPEMGQLYERQFADELGLFRRRFVDTPAPQPLVLNSGTRPGGFGSRLRYDWE